MVIFLTVGSTAKRYEGVAADSFGYLPRYDLKFSNWGGNGNWLIPPTTITVGSLTRTPMAAFWLPYHASHLPTITRLARVLTNSFLQTAQCESHLPSTTANGEMSGAAQREGWNKHAQTSVDRCAPLLPGISLSHTRPFNSLEALPRCQFTEQKAKPTPLIWPPLTSSLQFHLSITGVVIGGGPERLIAQKQRLRSFCSLPSRSPDRRCVPDDLLIA